MSDLVAWLRAQLDEDERIAQAADYGRWMPEDKGITFEYRADDFHEGEAQARLVADSRANQAFIAEWYPDRVLTDVDAKRKILDVAEAAFAAERRDDHDAAAGMRAAEYELRILPALAQPYAGRDGWQEAWRIA